MEFIDVKQRVGKSVLVTNLKKSGAEVIIVTNGDWFPDANLIVDRYDLADIMGILYSQIEKEIKNLQGGTLDHSPDYLCFHLRNNTPEFLILKLQEIVFRFFDHLPWSPQYLMILHA